MLISPRNLQGLPGVAPTAAAMPCYHCGDPIPPTTHHCVVLDGESRPMCCAGCEAVAQTILDAGLGDYYRLRTDAAPSARERVPQLLSQAKVFESTGMAAAASHEAGENARETAFIIDGISCAACAWLIERTLASQPGVIDAMVNYATHRARVRYQETATNPGELLASMARLGYRGEPYDPARRETALGQERRARLRRIGVAGLFGMQVMMLAVVLYAGEWWGIDPAYESLFRGSSLLLTLPVITYCAWPWFVAAVRGLCNRAPGMDLPVALGLGLAFTASAYATLAGNGHVYFDSVVMFSFFLLLARYLEFLARQQAWQGIESLVSPTPDFAHRLRANGEPELLPVAELTPSDLVRILPGESVPADGVVIAGRSSVNEALLSGESRPISKQVGDGILAGSVNGTSPLDVRVEQVGAEMTVSRILALAEHAFETRPRLVRLADRVASAFVIAVVGLALGVALWWWHTDPDLLIPATVAVLVVTCPCALSLATPTALTAVTGALTSIGLVPARGLAIENLAQVDRVVFDKTGTLTCGHFELMETRSLGAASADSLLRTATALERHSEHPIARALERTVTGPVPAATDPVCETGCGISASIAGERWWIGRAQWVQQQSGCEPLDWNEVHDSGDSGDTVVLLASESGERGVLRFGDRIRDGARELVDTLSARGIGVSLLSGDSPQAVNRVADALGIVDRAGGLLPEDKLERLSAAQRQGWTCAMVGDGVNDAPVLAGASVSVAMGGGAQAARANADFILVNEDLSALGAAPDLARRARRTVLMNITWAVGYNITALPLAAMGWIAPWMAAIGMSLSSLIVILNSRRLRNHGRPPVRGKPTWR